MTDTTRYAYIYIIDGHFGHDDMILFWKNEVKKNNYFGYIERNTSLHTNMNIYLIQYSLLYQSKHNIYCTY